LLPHLNRLKKKSDFETVFKLGKRIKGEKLFLVYNSNNKKINRYGIVVSSKVSRKATERNRLKRQINESLRKFFEDIKIGYDVIFVAQNNLKGETYEKINFELVVVLIKSGLLKKSSSNLS
jgi:ribonuclease P protein component